MMKKLIYLTLLLPLFVNAQTSLPTLWTFSTPGIATPPEGWTTGLGTNGNLTYSGANNSSGDAISCRLDATGEFLTIWFADKPGPVSYWLRGTGIAPTPAFTGTFNVEQSVDGAVWTTLRSFTTAVPAPGSMTRFVDNPSLTSRYIRFFYTSKEAGSNIALDSVLIRSAPASPLATINVKKGSSNIVNNTTYVVGNTPSTTITIENKGTSEALTITSISFTGEDAADFSTTGVPTSIPANSSADFVLNFNAANLGSHKATMSIVSNDLEKGNYQINLYGIGGTLASEPSNQPSNILFTNVKPFTFNSSFRPSNPRAEYYLILRKNGSTITETPVDGKTYSRGDYIGNAQVVYAGPDSTFKPTYIFANSTYSFSVFSVNGPAGFENYQTANPLKGTITTPGNNPANYYAGMNSAANNFVSSLSAKINPHDTVFYSQYIGTVINNFLTRDTSNGKKLVNCVYTGSAFVYAEPFLWWTGTNTGKLTREHTFAQSWMPSNAGSPTWPNDPITGKEVPEYNDLHHLFPTDQEIGNVKRSNLPFGEIVGTPTYVSPTGFGKIGNDANGKQVYEPRNEQKGDLARALFYMTVAYNGINGKNWSLGSITAAQQDQAILKKWHFQDLPDAYELARHEYIFSLQKNRNPFIDSVNYACRINFNNLSWIATPDPSCGVVIPELTLTSPNGGVTWWLSDHRPRGSVNWYSEAIDSVQIELFVSDTLFYNFGFVDANERGYEASLSDMPISTNKAKIKLTGKNHPLTSISSDYFRISYANGINNTDGLSAAYNIFPNPSTKNVTIELNDLTIQSTNIIITDISGRVVLEKPMQSSTTVSLDKPGVYFVKLKTENGSVVKKLIVY